MDNGFLTVTELGTYIKNIIYSEDLLHGICVAGEISGYKTSGLHAYFTLKDENCQLQCTCFNFAKTYRPRDGEAVLVFGSVDYYAKGGRLSFNASKIEPYGIGVLARKLEELKKKLSDRGYFDDTHKKRIPAFCKSVCVVTSREGAVIRDICATVREKNKLTDIYVYNVCVQGVNCAKSVADAVKKADKMGFDCIVIARGGGSMEDLMGFNDEELVYAVYNSATPIISAVGHETDYTLCDMAADLRVPTPTAAGKLFAYDIELLKEEILNKIQYMKRCIIDKYDNRSLKLRNSASALSQYAYDRYHTGVNRLELAKERLNSSVSGKYDAAREKLLTSLRILNAHDPATVLEKGYFTVTSGGSHIEGVSRLKRGDIVEINSYDGTAVATVDKIMPH